MKPRPPPPSLLARSLHALPDGVCVTSAQWKGRGLRILFANERFATMTGHAAAELPALDHTFLHIDRKEVARQRRWIRHLKPGKTYASEGYVVRRDGSAFFAAWQFSPLCDANGQITHIVSTYRDITERRKLQDSLLQAQRIDAVGRLAGGVAHDFNNLLSVINGYSEILADRLTHDERARQDLAEIHSAGQKAAALTRQLLAFSRRQAMEPRVVSLNHLITEHAELLGRLLRPDRHLRFELCSELTHVRVDPAALQQVLLNLTLNARDALSPGGHVILSTSVREVKPSLSSRRLSEMPPGRYVQLTVSDSGSGMDEHVQAHLFEPFFTTKPQGQGTGLGLALVYSVVQQSGGFISFQSQPKVGTTFEICLPEVNEPAHPRLPLLAALPSTGGRETVLVIEEDDVLRKMIAGILTSDGYRVRTARSPAEALPEARSGQPPVDLVIVDGGDASGDAPRLIRALLLRQPGVRVMSTSSVDSPDPLPWVAPEAQAHLSKPFTLSTLLRAIRDLLDAASSAADQKAV